MNDLFFSPKRSKLFSALLFLCLVTPLLAQEKPLPADSIPPIPPVKPTPAPLVFAAYDPEKDVMLNPPATPCALVQDTRDEFSGAVLRQTAFLEIFQYSNPALKTFLEGRTQIRCEAALAQKGNDVQLLLSFRIIDPNARKSFGRIERGALAMLQLMDGEVLNLQCSTASDGDFDPDTQDLRYQVRYALDGSAARKIKKTEIDKIRIAWSAGYEDYDVQQVDVLEVLSGCLGR